MCSYNNRRWVSFRVTAVVVRKRVSDGNLLHPRRDPPTTAGTDVVSRSTAVYPTSRVTTIPAVWHTFPVRRKEKKQIHRATWTSRNGILCSIFFPSSNTVFLLQHIEHTRARARCAHNNNNYDDPSFDDKFVSI